MGVGIEGYIAGHSGPAYAQCSVPPKIAVSAVRFLS